MTGNCPRCKDVRPVKKFGFSDGCHQRWRCKKCGKTWTGTADKQIDGRVKTFTVGNSIELIDYENAAMILKQINQSGDPDAMTAGLVASEMATGRHIGFYLGPCYEAVRIANRLRIFELEKVKQIAKRFVKRMLKDTYTGHYDLQRIAKHRWGSHRHEQCYLKSLNDGLVTEA